jgi:hypothetical protein
LFCLFWAFFSFLSLFGLLYGFSNPLQVAHMAFLKKFGN